MDTSKQYIKMCEKAQEIQSMWKHSERNDGDWYYHKGLENVYVVTDIDQQNKDCIYLPRQDQLQEMIEDESLSDKVKSFHYFNYDSGFIWLSDIHFTSFEQLWLAFVMKEKYNKSWNNEKELWEQV